MNRFRWLYYSSTIASAFLLSLAISGNAPFNANAKEPENLNPTWRKEALSQLKAETQAKIRIAVLDFDFSSVSNPSLLTYFQGSSKGVSDILVTKLVQDGNFIVIERSQIEAILREQNLGASGRLDPATAAQIGRILGVEVVMIGTVTQFDLQRQEGNYIVVRKTETDTDVALNVRLVSTTTAEIVLTAQGKGHAENSDTAVFSIGEFTAKDSQLLTEATEKAVDQIMTELNANSAKLTALPKPLPAVNALVADIAGNTVILNKGSAEGYRVGMRVSIERLSRTVKDPATGKVIRQLTQPIGLIELLEVDNQSSVGRVVSGSQFKIGDIGKPTH